MTRPPTSTQRSRLSEQLLQSSLLQRLVSAIGDAIAPAANLLHREPMTGVRVAHLNLNLRSLCDRLDRLPNAGRVGEADRARPQGHGASEYHIRFIFAHANQDE
jgi:hypothetical protein